MITLNDLTKNLTLQKDDGPITAVRLVKGYDNSYALNAAGQITALSLGNSKIKKLVLGAEAANVEYLYLSGSESLTEVVFEVPLPHLTHLYLNNCAITQITFPAGFRSLQQIYLQKNGLQRLVFEGDCPALVLMDVSENKLKMLDFSLGFRQLQYLYASQNLLEGLNLNRSMRQLNTLHLAENRLTTIAPYLSEVKAMETLYLKGNRLGTIDREVWDTERNSWDTMKGYLISLNKGNVTREYLHEAKMILIGNGEVGKTSIRVKLLDINAKLPEKEDRTPGLDVVPYTIPNLSPAQTGLPYETSFRFNIWDFGGQGKYREIQQLFFSRKSLYLYVTACDDKPNYKEAYVGYEYWLSMANAYNHDNGQNSPVLYVQNKCDKEKEAINESEIKTKFNNIEDFIKISCTDIQKFTLLPKVIAESIAKISDDIFSVQYNAEWLGVKQDLNDLKERGVNHISKQRFDEICRERGLNEDEIKAWLVVLDRIGTIIYFGDNDKLSDWIVLNPIWVKDAVCKVIDFEFYDDIATLKPSFLPKIWKEYDSEERQKLQALLLAYDFCYEENGAFIVPALFSEEKPVYPTHLATFDCEIKLDYKPFLPAGTLHKFMVRLNSCIYNDLRWKKGVVLHDGATNTYAEVIEHWEEHSIYIRLKGEKHLNLLWNTVQYSFEELNATLKSTKFIKNLEFEVRYNYDNDWYTETQMAKICKLDDKNVFKGLLNLGTRSLGKENETPNKKMIDNSKPYPVPMAEGAREFVPFSEVEGKVKVLFIAANPTDASRLKTDVEYRKIRDEMNRGRHRDKFDFLPPQLAVTIQELVRAMNDKPHIVHFSGHGEEEGILITTGENVSQLLPTPAIKRLFKPLQGSAQVVLLNACYSATQAEEISKFGFYVVGHQEPIGDDAAIGFAQGLYNGLGEGKSFEEAYNDAMVVLLTIASDYGDVVAVWKDGQKLAL